MSDEPDNLTLRYLRRLDDKLDRVLDKQDEHTRRIGALERNVASLMVSVADLSARMDGFDLRVARIERRLDLVDERAAS